MADIRSLQNIVQVEWTILNAVKSTQNIVQVEWGEAVAGWTGKICGVTNPAKINGIAVANIGKVIGVS